MKNNHIKSGIKSIIWRIIGILILATITYVYTRSWIITSLVTIIHHITFLIVFYYHEMIWAKFKKPSGWWRKIAKMFTYETLCGNIILGIITYLITGSWKTMTAITLTYIGIKHLLYILNEFLWQEEIEMVYTYVVGDILHIGHIIHLERARNLAGKGKVIVGVLTNKATMEKKSKPVINFEERVRTINSLKYVDVVIPQKTYSPLSNIKKIKPDIVMESESHNKKDIEEIRKFVESYGGRVFISPYYKLQSSTKIKEKIKKTWKS